MADQLATEPLKRPRMRPPVLPASRTPESHRREWRKEMVRRLDTHATSQHFRLLDFRPDRNSSNLASAQQFRPASRGKHGSALPKTFGLPKVDALHNDAEDLTTPAGDKIGQFRRYGSLPRGITFREPPPRTSSQASHTPPKLPQSASFRATPSDTPKQDASTGTTEKEQKQTTGGDNGLYARRPLIPDSTAIVTYRPSRSPGPESNDGSQALSISSAGNRDKRSRAIKVIPIKGVMVYKTGIKVAFNGQQKGGNRIALNPATGLPLAPGSAMPNGIAITHQPMSPEQQRKSTSGSLTAVRIRNGTFQPSSAKDSKGQSSGEISLHGPIMHLGRRFRLAPTGGPAGPLHSNPLKEKPREPSGPKFMPSEDDEGRDFDEIRDCLSKDDDDEDDDDDESESGWYNDYQHSLIDRLIRKQKIAQRLEQVNSEWENYDASEQIPIDASSSVSRTTSRLTGMTASHVPSGMSTPQFRRRRSVRFHHADDVCEFTPEEAVPELPVAEDESSDRASSQAEEDREVFV